MRRERGFRSSAEAARSASSRRATSSTRRACPGSNRRLQKEMTIYGSSDLRLVPVSIRSRSHPRRHLGRQRPALRRRNPHGNSRRGQSNDHDRLGARQLGLGTARGPARPAEPLQSANDGPGLLHAQRILRVRHDDPERIPEGQLRLRSRQGHRVHRLPVQRRGRKRRQGAHAHAPFIVDAFPHVLLVDLPELPGAPSEPTETCSARTTPGNTASCSRRDGSTARSAPAPSTSGTMRAMRRPAGSRRRRTPRASRRRYLYDALGRVHRITPPVASELSTFVCYEGASATTAYRASSPQACPVAASNAAAATWQHYEYDGLARLVREKRLQPSSSVVKRFTLYDGPGNAYFTSEWVSDATSEIDRPGPRDELRLQRRVLLGPRTALGGARHVPPLLRPVRPAAAGRRAEDVEPRDDRSHRWWSNVYSDTREAVKTYCVNATFSNLTTPSCGPGGINATDHDPEGRVRPDHERHRTLRGRHEPHVRRQWQAPDGRRQGAQFRTFDVRRRTDSCGARRRPSAGTSRTTRSGASATCGRDPTRRPLGQPDVRLRRTARRGGRARRNQVRRQLLRRRFDVRGRQPRALPAAPIRRAS